MLKALIGSLRQAGHALTRAHRLIKRHRQLPNGEIRKESLAEPCDEYLSMGSKPIPFVDVYKAICASGFGKIRVYLPFNRKQRLLEFFSEIGEVFDEENILYDPDTVTDVGVTFPIQDMVVFGILKTSLIKNCKVHSMHLSAGKGGGSLQFSFTDPFLKGIKACVYPEAARWVKSSKRCGHKPVMNRSSFRNQCTGQELLALFLADMAQHDSMTPLMGYRIEYRIERSPNIFQTVRNLRDNDLFRWVGLCSYLGSAIQRMIITDSFLELAEWLIPKAKSLVWDKGGHPTELDRMRTIEVWNFYGINSYWQTRADQIRFDMSHWIDRRAIEAETSQALAQMVAAVDIEHLEELCRIPEAIIADMRCRLKLRPNGKRWTATLLNPKGRARKQTFANHDDLYLSVYQEYGDDWDQFVVTNSRPA